MYFDELIELATKEYGLKAIEFKTMQYGNDGQCFPETGTIWLADKYKSCTRSFNPHLFNQKVFIFFHELGHIHCYNNDIWERYHKHKPYSEFTLEEIPEYVEYALDAEQWVDQWAATEMAKNFPEITYPFTYSIEHVRDTFRTMVTRILTDMILHPEIEHMIG